MTSDEFDLQFQAAAKETGPVYVKARDGIVGMRHAALPSLQAKRQGGDWQSLLAADILSGWITNKDLFDRATEFIKGNLPGKPPITGQFTPEQRAKVTAQLGRDVTPRLLEILSKTREFGTGDDRQALFGAISILRDSRAVPVLLELLATSEDSGLRVLAADSLGKLEDLRAAPALEAIMKDPSQSKELRGVCAIGVGQLRTPNASALLQGILLDQGEDLALLKSAARGLSRLGDTQATATLLQALDRNADVELTLILIDTLGELGNASCLPALRRLASNHPDRFVRESARDAQELVAERSKQPAR